jgi:hypothetical protein
VRNKTKSGPLSAVEFHVISDGNEKGFLVSLFSGLVSEFISKRAIFVSMILEGVAGNGGKRAVL